MWTMCFKTTNSNETNPWTKPRDFNVLNGFIKSFDIVSYEYLGSSPLSDTMKNFWDSTLIGSYEMTSSAPNIFFKTGSDELIYFMYVSGDASDPTDYGYWEFYDESQGMTTPYLALYNSANLFLDENWVLNGPIKLTFSNVK